MSAIFSGLSTVARVAKLSLVAPNRLGKNRVKMLPADGGNLSRPYQPFANKMLEECVLSVDKKALELRFRHSRVADSMRHLLSVEHQIEPVSVFILPLIDRFSIERTCGENEVSEGETRLHMATPPC